MERSSASVGSGIFRCRSGCPLVVGGCLNPKWVPLGAAGAAVAFRVTVIAANLADPTGIRLYKG
jgi:hypothetical protein